jgi:N6-adenosine-specific RNA methylase IME4
MQSKSSSASKKTDSKSSSGDKKSLPAKKDDKGIGLITVLPVTFNNISVILWQSVLLVEETRVPERKPDELYHINEVIYRS